MKQNEQKQCGTMGHRIKHLTVGILCVFGLVANCLGAGTLTPVNSGMKPVKIESHHVKVTINNGFAITEVVQRFVNQNSQVTEAIYSFPLPESASLSEVTIQIGEQIINGEVVDKSKADKIYNEEKKQGNNAGVAKKNGYQDFKFMVANIKPNEAIIIKFVYYQPLKLNADVGRYVYPLAEGNTDEAAKSFWERNEKVESNITVAVELKSAWPLSNVRAPGYAPLRVKKQLTAGYFKAGYELSAELNKDFVLYYRLQNNLPGRLEVIPYHQPGAKEGTFMMVVTPGLDLKPLTNGADYLFVLDISGSMGGEKIRTLCDGIARVLGKMQPKDRFKIVTFESSAHDFTGGWVTADVNNVKGWIEKVKKIKVRGGTNLYAGMSEALSDIDADRATSIVLVTDAVTNTGVVKPKKFHELLKKYDIRVFGFMIGNSGNWPLMRLICDVSGGFYAGVSNSDDIIGQVMLAKQKITHESLHNAKIKIGGVETFDLTGNNLRKIYCGQQLVIFGRYRKGGKATVTLAATLTGTDKTYSTTVNFPDVDTDNPELERLWAMSQIEMLEDLTNSGMMPPKETESAIRDLGVKYQLVTNETSMLVLSDDAFKKHSIERRNQQRLAIEHHAQSRRAVQPVKNYRSQGKPMFNFNLPSVGGGAVDPFSALLMILTGVGACAGIAGGVLGKK